MNAFKFLALLVFLSIVTLSCQSGSSKMIYLETKCADIWQTKENTPTDVLISKVSDYLSQQGIEFEEIEVIMNEEYAQNCEACVCMSGRVIRLSATGKHVEGLNNLGFVKE